jgi:predicted ATPase/DNA-binding CsgD family transcriptional regulator
VLDNFEQVMPAASLLVDLLSSCPMLKILVTSREVLHLFGEHHFPVVPLAFPDPAHLPPLDMLDAYPAVELFLQRAQSIIPDMALNPATMGAIARVCAKVEGLPLAIELAAARVKLLPPQALATRLDHRLDVLTQGGPDMPARHKTLRATFAWSRNLLTGDEQKVFRRLSVFVGGCTLDAAEAVCNGDLKDSFLDVVSSLVDKSLLQTASGEAEEPRVFLLETIREYAAECLAEGGELERVQAAHAAYFLAFAEQVSTELYGRQEEMWLDRLEHDSENLRAAFIYLLAQHDHKRAARLTNALGRFWQTRGRAREGLDWASQAQVSAHNAGQRTELRNMELRHVESSLSGTDGSTFRGPRAGVPRPAGLTKRELEALLLVAEGLSNEQIADRLVVSTSTVKTYLSAIYAKLRVSSRTAAMRYVIDNYLNMA